MSGGGGGPVADPAPPPNPRREGPTVPRIAIKTSGNSTTTNNRTGSNGLRVLPRTGSGAPKVGLNIPSV